MDTRTAMQALGVTEETLTSEQRRGLDEDGSFVVEEAFNEEQRARMAEEVDRIAAK